MAKVSRDETAVNARIVYWGVEGAGKTANLRAAHAKLRPDHRGEIRRIPTRIDPTASYEVLPIALGEIAGVRTQIEMVTVPGGPEQAPTRMHLLDQVDGIVLVVDGQAHRADANVESVEELRRALAAYGRAIEELPLVVQYNKRDLSDPYALEDLHRKLGLVGSPVFEAVATQGTGVLQTLSTISKRVIRALREQAPVSPREPTPANLGEPEPANAREPAPAEAPRRRSTDLEPEPESVRESLPQPAARPAEPRPAPSPEIRRPAAPEVGPSPEARMEAAILDESEHPDSTEVDEAAHRTETLLDAPWQQVSGEIARPTGIRLGPDVSIVSVGEARRAGDRSVSLPIVLGDAEGQTTTVVLTIGLEPLVDEDSA